MMEWSALVYILLTVITVAFGLCVDNQDYVPDYIRGGRRYPGPPGAGSGHGLCERRQVRNRIAVAAI